MAVIKDLGAVTAYASAVEGGYTGTKAEFETLMASYASVAEEAAESAESASQSASTASASAQTATTKASEASTSATQAGASATSASQSAQTAIAKASEASASASTAGTKASEASTSASTATQKASEASASATSAQTAQGLAESARDDAIDAKTDAETARDLAQQYAESIDPEKIYSAYPTDTASGSVASFADGADGIPLKSCVVAIEPVQSGSGDPSPDNVRPISGWTGVQVMRTGKNLLDGTFVNMAIGTTDAGVKIAENPVYRGMYSHVVGGNTYTVSRKLIETNRFRICATIEEPANNIGAVNLSNVPANDSLYSITVTLPEGYNYLFVYLSNNSETCTPDNYQIELGSTATEYEPYTGDTYSITFPSEAGTVYGGTLDVTNGVLTVDRAGVDLGTLEWQFDNTVFYTSSAPMFGSGGSALVNNTVIFAENKCEIYKSDVVSLSNPVNGRFFVTNSQETPILRVSDDRFSDVESFKTAMDGVMAIFKLKESVVYTLTPTEIKSLLGDNNIWADAGDTEVTYRADTAMYIDKKIAEVINALS